MAEAFGGSPGAAAIVRVVTSHPSLKPDPVCAHPNSFVLKSCRCHPPGPQLPCSPVTATVPPPVSSFPSSPAPACPTQQHRAVSKPVGLPPPAQNPQGLPNALLTQSTSPGDWVTRTQLPTPASYPAPPMPHIPPHIPHLTSLTHASACSAVARLASAAPSAPGPLPLLFPLSEPSAPVSPRLALSLSLSLRPNIPGSGSLP